MFKAFKTLKTIKQLQKVMHDSSAAFLLMQDIGLMPESVKGEAKARALHDMSHVLKDILEGKSLDEAMERLEITVETDEDDEEMERLDGWIV